MIYTLILLIIFTLFLLAKNYINRYTWFFVAMMFSLEISICFAIIYISKVESYLYPRNFFFFFDYQLFLLFNGIKVRYYTLSRIMNIGTAGYTAMVPLFVNYFTCQKSVSASPKRMLEIGAILILPVFYIVFYDPSTSYSFYILVNETADEILRNRLILGIGLIDLFNYIWVVLYQTAPILSLVSFYKRTIVGLKKKQILSIAICLSALSLLCGTLFVFGPFKEVYFLSGDTALLGFKQQGQIPNYYYIMMPFIVLVMVITMMFVLIRYKGIDGVDFFRQKILQKNVSGLNTNLRNVFHSFKNTLFTLEILGKQAQREYGSPKQLETLTEMEQMTRDSIESITKMLDTLKEIKLTAQLCKVSDLVEQAIKRVKISGEITISRQYQCTDAEIYADAYYIVDVFVNLIQNAVESIEAAKKEAGKITVELMTEHEWVVLKITDNGTGIRKKDVNNIFKEFYTTKSRRQNWGIGLSHAYKVVKKHLGYITVESVYNEYTRFQILFPKA